MGFIAKKRSALCLLVAVLLVLSGVLPAFSSLSVSPELAYAAPSDTYFTYRDNASGSYLSHGVQGAV